MISKDYITEWRDQAPWATDAQVQHEQRGTSAPR